MSTGKNQHDGETSAGMVARPLEQRVLPGDSFSIKHHFDGDDIATFALSSGDRNPVHRDAAAAAQSRFAGRIASAEHTIALLAGLAASWLSERGTAIGLGCSFRFTAAVREGDTLELRWTVSQTYHKASLRGLIVCLDGTAIDQHDRLAMKGTMEWLLQE